MSRVEDLQKKIKDFEHKEKYSKDPLQKINLRKTIGKLQKELKIAKLKEKNNE